MIVFFFNFNQPLSCPNLVTWPPFTRRLDPPLRQNQTQNKNCVLIGRTANWPSHNLRNRLFLARDPRIENEDLIAARRTFPVPPPRPANQQRACGLAQQRHLACPRVTWWQSRALSATINCLFTPLVVDSNIVFWYLSVRLWSATLLCSGPTSNDPLWPPRARAIRFAPNIDSRFLTRKVLSVKTCERRVSTCWRTGAALRQIETAFSRLLSFHFIVPNIVIVPSMCPTLLKWLSTRQFSPGFHPGQTTATTQSGPVNHPVGQSGANSTATGPRLPPDPSMFSFDTMPQKILPKIWTGLFVHPNRPGQLKICCFCPGRLSKGLQLRFSLLF